MKKIKNIFLSSIHQDAGKTTVALGLYKILKEKKIKVSFMKPVGQEYVTVNHTIIDKDSYLMREVYHFKQLKELSPVTVGRGFTEDYIFHPRKDKLKNDIIKSYKVLSQRKDMMIIEGTGHAGVGSVIDFSNADVAELLGSKVIIVSGGGIGRSIDEIILNKALFDLKGVEVLGVIANKVLPEKYEKIKRALSRGLKNKGIRLLGVIPVDPILSSPTIEQVMSGLKFKLLTGKENLSRHVHSTIVAAMEPHHMLNYLKGGTLVITSGDRMDNILVTITARIFDRNKRVQIAGIILTGGLIPDENIIRLLRKSKIPVLLAREDTYTVAGKVEHLTIKIQKTDKDKIIEARQIVKKYVDVKAILENLQRCEKV